MTFSVKLAFHVAATRPDLFQKAAAEFLASQFPSLSAAFDAYSQSRQYQNALQAQRDAMAFPALHATQPAMYYANQQTTVDGNFTETVQGSAPLKLGFTLPSAEPGSGRAGIFTIGAPIDFFQADCRLPWYF